jgi:hypothetical protein
MHKSVSWRRNASRERSLQGKYRHTLRSQHRSNLAVSFRHATATVLLPLGPSDKLSSLSPSPRTKSLQSCCIVYSSAFLFDQDHGPTSYRANAGVGISRKTLILASRTITLSVTILTESSGDDGSILLRSEKISPWIL